MLLVLCVVIVIIVIDVVTVWDNHFLSGVCCRIYAPKCAACGLSIAPVEVRSYVFVVRNIRVCSQPSETCTIRWVSEIA